ncbi:Transposase InsO and inactivated derivatives [Pseudomonas syringae pv. actinidiae]|uniref:Transposase InsO and inactivated derivatives n=1 Tax=Pseudomonas syringae pv. actinidiae TaxID=103796 RepID=A0A2V0QGJ4_PSESF|nr:Transposase InsO and inactivated derivatives [Pseudomonas syringae pv. actinidiae]
MLKKVKELGRCVVLGAGSLLQPFLKGVGQRTVGAAEAEHRRGQHRLLVVLLNQAFNLAGGENRCQRAAQPHRFGMRRCACAQRRGLRLFALQHQQRLQQLKGLRRLAQGRA